MKKIVSCSQMKNLDRHTIEVKKVPSLVLMERAALSVAEEMVKEPGRLQNTLVVCGMGNNGGDGAAIARILFLWGYQVSLLFLGNPEHMSEETKRQKEICDSYGVPETNNPCWNEYTTIVDAVFGIGLSRNVQGVYQEMMEQINQSGAYIWAVDIPSGINGDTGAVMGMAVRADETVTFAFAKAGHYLYPGTSFCGKLHVKDIGIYMEPDDRETYLHCPEISDFKCFPEREKDGNKGTFGKILIVAGSCNMAGAAYLSARAALLTGAGMVKIHTVEENRMILQQLLPEALLYTDSEKNWEERKKMWQKNLDWADVVVVGPGIGQEQRARELTAFYLKNCRKPMVVDADALNIIAAEQHLKEFLGNHCILTPHMGEFSRLTGISISKLKENPVFYARRTARTLGAVCVAKDARTVTALADETIYLNLSGNDGMATAGSGDVLSGILGGLLGQYKAFAMVAPLGVYLHGLAGDEACRTVGKRCMTAADILQGLAAVLKKIEE